MRFCIITHATHKEKNGNFFAYEPYVREMNLWLKYVGNVEIIAPKLESEPNAIEIEYQCNNIFYNKVSSIQFTSLIYVLKSIFLLPSIFLKLFKACKRADHIHLRCPGNMGLLGCLVQIFFPNKKKTVKYAGNWDPESKQPLSYKFQRWIVSNTFLTKNCKVLVYGDWPNQTKNIVPFFTASYFKSEITEIIKKDFTSKIRLLFVGGLTEGKQPLLTVIATHELIKKGYNVSLDLYGDGIKRNEILTYLRLYKLEKSIILHGNVSKEVVKKAFKEAHFLIFISKSEGWPKVVAEAMFWSCLPISSNVSCINYMLGNNKRGTVLNANVFKEDIVIEIESYIKNKIIYKEKVLNAKRWSQNFTLDKFENEIKKIIDA
ncbi:glycosyltransferase [uncultured Polaribacter sp.]|uniref:glycosyltransferase n=1 Tax=uncultured Polaribacter sp. TaxID=174711 RepID=UPI002628E029|nr:glycosyltransferase [uncultured Polaribacter sp.]